MEMIEKVARALCSKHYAARFDKPADDEHVQMNVNAGWHIFKEDARAAIEAMREPTEAMMRALRFYGMLDGDPEEAWEKTILSALDPSTPLRGS